MPRLPLLMTATLTGIPSIAQVASSWLVIWKQPSPSIAHTVASGRPDFAPRGAATREADCGAPPRPLTPHGRVPGAAVLGAHGRRHGVAHRPEPTAVEPGARL